MRPTNLDKCNFCGGITKEYLTIKDLPIFTGVPNNKPREDCLDFSTVICKHCGLIQQKQSASLNKKLEKIYLSKKAFLSTPLGEGEWGKKRLDNFLEDTEINTIPEEILDVGCGTGALLFKFFRRGCKNLAGFEPSHLARNISNPDEGFSPKIYNDFFSLKSIKKNELEEKYNLIIATAVLEHILNLKDFLSALRFTLKETGNAIITVPNELFAFKIGDPGSILHEHLNYFTPATIKNILSSAGFRVFFIKIKRDILVVKFKKTNRKYKFPKRKTAGGELLLKKYSEKLARVISRFKKIVTLYKKNRIGLYGACATSFNLLGLSNLKELKNIFFLDSDPLKWGKKLFGIPIISPKEILGKGLGVILIMPPAFQKEISEYLNLLSLPETIKTIKFWKNKNAEN